MMGEENLLNSHVSHRKVPIDTCSTMNGWKQSTSMMCLIDRLNIINSHRTNKVKSGKQGFG